MGTALYVYGNVNSTGLNTASVTRYGAAVGSTGDPCQQSATVEANVSGTLYAAGTISDYYKTVNSNARTSDTTFTIRLNSADTAVTVTFTSGQTGTKSDTSHTATVAANDVISEGGTTGINTGSLVTAGSAFRFVPTSGTVSTLFNVLSAGLTASGTGPITNLLPLAGTMTASFGSANEADAQINIPQAATLRYYQMNVGSNGRSTDTVITLRVNGANGNQTFTYTAAQTGTKVDTTHTDSVSAGDKICGQFVLGTGTGNFNMTMHGVVVDATNAGETTIALSRQRTLTAGSTLYSIVAGGAFNPTATETAIRSQIGTACTASKLWCYVNSNVSTTNSTVRFRKGGANGNQVVTVTALTTGAFQDTTNSDSIAATDPIDYQFAGATTGSVIFSAVSALLSVANDVTVAITGVSATGAVGTVVANTDLPVTGASGTGQVGTVTATPTVAAIGVNATGQAGNVTPATAVAITGVSGTGQVGNVTTTPTISITGVNSTGQVGGVSPATSVAPTGASATGQAGNVFVQGDVTVAITGVQATGQVGSVSASGTVVSTGGHFIPLTEKQLRELRKRERKERKAREDRDDARKMDADSIAAEIQAHLLPRTITQADTVNLTENAVNDDDSDEDLELILLHA